MKFAIHQLLIFCGAIFQAKADGGFEIGKVYTYQYEGKHGTGITNDELQQFSGQGFQASITVQNDDGVLKIKISNFKHASFNEKTENFLEKLNLAYEPMSPREGIIEKEHIMWAEYMNGVVKAIHTPPETDEAVVNGLRAIASLLQTNLQPLMTNESSNYRVEEGGIGGDCLTLYNVVHRTKDNTDTEDMIVLKTRLFDQCKHRPHLFFSSMIGNSCPHCAQKNLEVLQSSRQVKYHIKMTEHKYTIVKIESNGAITFTPFTTNGQTIISTTNQTLSLVSITDRRASSSIPADAVKSPSLSYVFHNDLRDLKNINLNQAHYYNRIFHNAKEIKESLEELHELLSPSSNATELQKITKMTDAFREMDYDNFVAFFREISNKTMLRGPYSISKNDRNKWDLLFRILPFVGTNPSILFLFKLIEERRMFPSQAHFAITTFAFHVKEPSAILLEKMSEFLEDHETELVYRRLKEDFSLAFGTMIFKACVKHEFNSHPQHDETYSSYNECSRNVNILLKMFEESMSIAKKSVYLRALANTRFETTLPFFLRLLRNKDHDVNHMHRLAAFWGIYHFCFDPVKQPQISDVLLSIYHNTMEDYQLRIYAITFSLMSGHSERAIGVLGNTLSNEPNERVFSYMVNILKLLANSSDPCYESLKESSRQVLQYVSHRILTRDLIKHGALKQFSFFNDKYNYGRILDIVLVPGRESFLPRDVYFKHGINFLGYNFDVFEMGTSGKDLSVHGKILDVIWLTRLVDSNFYVGDQESPHDNLKRLRNRFSVLEQNKPPLHTNVDLYVRKFGQFISSGNLIDKIVEFIEHLTEPSTGRVLDFVELSDAIPNDMGVPVTLSLQVPLSIRMKGKFYSSMDYNVTLSMNFELRARMLANVITFHSTGYQLTTKGSLNLPLNNDGFYRENKFKVSYNPPQESYELFSCDSAASTIAGTSTTEGLPVKRKKEATQKTYSVGHNYLGFGLTFNFRGDDTRMDHGTYHKFFKSILKMHEGEESFFNPVDVWFARTLNLQNYALLNPTGQPFHLSIHMSPSRETPTSQIQIEILRQASQNSSNSFEATTDVDYRVMVSALGPVVRKWELHLKSKRNWPYRDRSHTRFNFKRSPLPGFDANSFEMCFDGDKTIDGLSYIYGKPLPEMKSVVKWQYDADIILGESCENNFDKIHFELIGGKSEEQQKINPKKSTIYKKCQKDVEMGNEFSYDCHKVTKDLARIDKFMLDVDYSLKHFPQLKQNIRHVIAGFSHAFQHHVHVDHSQDRKEENRLHILANFSYYDPVVDIKVSHAKESITFYDVHVPSVFPSFEPVTVMEYPLDRFLRKVLKIHKPVCILSGNYVKTLDNVKYEKPASGLCYHLAFSSIDHQQLAVFVSDQSLKAHFGFEVVEIIKTGDRLDVFANGDQKVVDDSKSLTVELREEFYYFRRLSPIRIFQYYSGYVVKSPEHGIEIYFDGHNIKIMPSFLYYGRSMGLCGNYDGNKDKEFTSPDGKLHTKVADFVKSFAALQDDCEI